MKRKLLLLLIMLSLGYWGWGQKTWTGLASDGLWASANNWNGGTVPTSTDNVVLDNSNVSGSYTITINNGSAQTIHSLQIGYTGNENTITLIVSGPTINVLTINGGGTTALYIMDGGVLSNQSTNGTRGIKLGSSSDVFKMSGTGRYVHVTTTTGSAIPELTNSTSSANYDFAITSVFENQSGSAASFDANPVYGNYIYNNSSGNSAAKNLIINGNLSVLQGTLGVCAGSTNTFTIAGNISISNGATFRGSSGTSTATINVTGNINGAGTFAGSTGSSSTTIINVGGDITSQVSLNTGINTLTFTGGSSSVNFSPANSNPSIRGFTIASGKTVTLTNTITIPSSYIVTINNGGTFVTGTDYKNNGTLIVNGIFDCGTNAISGSGAFTLSSGATLKTANISGINGSITITGTKTIDNAANYEFNGTSEQVTGALLPTTINNLTIDNAAGVKLSNSALTVSGNLTINDGKLFTIESGKQVSVVGTLTNNGTLTLQSPGDNGAPGSLITNGTVSGNVIAERYIAAYTTATDGWHLVSSPVNGAVIGNFQPEANDDFYKYNEASNTWMNWKVSPFDFTNGEGYLCSYQSAATKSFTGVPNNANVSFSNMSLTSTRGWHLLGNPFPCAIKWNDGNWTLTNINTTAKVLNSGGSYTDITANGIIPAMQGFFVEVTNSTNSITIPKAARVHDATAWYKDTQANKLVLTAQSDNNNTYTETVVRFDPEATTGFDEAFDSHFLNGIYGTPQFYSIVGNEKLSSNVFPVSGEVSTIPLGFVKGNADSYTLSASGIETFTNGQSVILEDLKTGIQQKLNDNPVYSFASATGDDANRFQLKLGAASGINEPSASPFSIYVSNGIVYVNNSDNQTLKGTVTVYSVTGQAITTRSLSGDRLQKFSFNSKPGCYIVRVTTDKGVYSQKIIL